MGGAKRRGNLLPVKHMKRIVLTILTFLFSSFLSAQEITSAELIPSITQKEMQTVKTSFLGFPVQDVHHEYYNQQLVKTVINFDFTEVKPYEITRAFTQTYDCTLDEMNSTDYMVCYKLADGNLAVFSLGVNFTLEVIFSASAEEKYHRTKPIIDRD